MEISPGSKQGAAEFTDRGLDIAVDNSGNAFICGQFSDTIQFATTYLNPVMNAIFLMKVDGNGNELFFRRASGTYSIAYAVEIDNAQNVYITGDYQGTLAFYGSPNNFINDNYSQRLHFMQQRLILQGLQIQQVATAYGRRSLLQLILHRLHRQFQQQIPFVSARQFH
ncbi:MAG: hypothetical protein M3R17_04000 [Bacteroidota bacterium]|nr:hypothetical protein [Bacteroidota bacterium]